jgi:hypothetical protein
MRKPLVSVAVIVAAIGAFVLSYKIAYPTTVYIYRMTVEVDVNGQTKSGSTVIRVERYLTPKWLPGGGMTVSHVYGEAAFVDLGAGQNVIATLRSGSWGAGPGGAESWPNWVLGPHDQSESFRIPLPRTELRDRQMPMFITFKNASDPRTLVRVPPDQFENVFNIGTKLKAIYVETSTDPITESLAQRLPWVATWPSGNKLSPTDSLDQHVLIRRD